MAEQVAFLRRRRAAAFIGFVLRERDRLMTRLWESQRYVTQSHG